MSTKLAAASPNVDVEILALGAVDRDPDGRPGFRLQELRELQELEKPAEQLGQEGNELVEQGSDLHAWERGAIRRLAIPILRSS